MTCWRHETDVLKFSASRLGFLKAVSDKKGKMDKKIYRIIQDKKLIVAMLSVFTLGMFAHGYAFSNLTFNHDSLVFFQNDVEYQISLGRFLHYFIFLLRGNYYVPWLVGGLSLFFLGLTSFLILKLFKIENTALVVAISGILAVNKVVTTTVAAYMHDLDIYMIALFFSVLAAFIALEAKTKKTKLLAVVPFVLSLGLYPAYFQVGMCIILFCLMMDLLNKKDEVKAIMKRALFYGLILGLSLVLYKGLSESALTIIKIPASTDYNSVGSAGMFASLAELLSTLKVTYITVFKFFLKPNIFNPIVGAFINAFLALTGIYMFAKILDKKQLGLKRIGLLLLVILTSPIALNFSCFLAKGMVHDLMIYSFVLVYVFYIYVTNLYLKTFKMKHAAYFRGLIILLFGILIFNSTVYANNRYFEKEVALRTTTTSINRLILKIEEIEEYRPRETKVYFIGGIDEISTNVLQTASTTYYPSTYKWFFSNMMNYLINLGGDANVKIAEEADFIKSMPIYPQKGSIAYKDGCVFVKIKDWPDK